MILVNILLYIVSFIWIWLGAGLIVASASKFSSKLRLSSFAFSFIFLGSLTSIPEFSVGLQSVTDLKPEIFVGNLLGGIIVLFLLIIPLLAVFGKGINLRHELPHPTLFLTLILILLPSFLVLDKIVTTFDGILMIIFYVALIYVIERKNGIFNAENRHLLNIKAYSYGDLLKILLGLGIVFAASNVIVDKTIFFAELFSISSFYISLLVIALGTNIPELSIAIRSVISGKKDVAMGDYLGSASFNTFLFGLFTLLHHGEVLTISNFQITFIFMTTALGLFYFFSVTKNYLSIKNGVFLLILYILFVFTELQ